MKRDYKEVRDGDEPPSCKKKTEEGFGAHPLFEIAPLMKVDARAYLAATGATPEGIALMTDKFLQSVIEVPDLTSREALILKQEMLSLGGEASVSGSALRDLDLMGDVLLAGTRKQYGSLVEKLKQQPFDLPAVGRGLGSLLDGGRPWCRIAFTARGRKLDLPPARVMGVLNVTPDSFSDGGRFIDTENAVEQGLRMAREGADFIDVGGESTRPFSEPLSAAEEKERVIPVIEEIRRRTECLISVDTYKSDVAAEALEAGAHIVNDVYAMRYSEDMAEVVRQYDAGIVLMHMKGTPQDMQIEPDYDNMLKEVYLFLRERGEAALEAGIPAENIMVDPGIGFGKRLCDNLEIVRNAGAFSSLGYPVLIGPSRKGFIGQITGRPVTERLSGTVAVSALAACAGAHVLRIHDVEEVLSGIRMAEAVRNHVEHR